MKRSLIILFFLSIVSLCFSASSPPDLKPEVTKEFVSDNQETVVIDINFEAVDFETIIIEKPGALFGSNCRHVLKSEAIYINEITFAFRNKNYKYDYGVKNMTLNNLTSNIEKVKTGLSSGGMPYLCSQIETI